MKYPLLLKLLLLRLLLLRLLLQHLRLSQRTALRLLLLFLRSKFLLDSALEPQSEVISHQQLPLCPHIDRSSNLNLPLLLFLLLFLLFLLLLLRFEGVENVGLSAS